ncbi:MAG: hypothetical protein J7639_21490 [Paenibacillaceae bacterium]|nr:hypothetical protein [Paenibacillaceae bacterium]
MTMETVTRDDWQLLFEAALAFKERAPWTDIPDAHYFAMTDPAGGETVYCVVLGNGGIDYGLNVYYGPNAAHYLQELTGGTSGPLAGDDREFDLSTQAVTVSFEDRQQLEKEDYELIRSLGYKFRGANAWPAFRNYVPGQPSWLPNREQVLLLAAGLEQASGVWERHRAQKGAPKGQEQRLHLVPHPDGNGGIVWSEEWQPWHLPGKLQLDGPPYEYPGEFRLKQAAAKAKAKLDEVWEADYGYAPVPVADADGRAIYPRLLLWANGDNGMILGVKLAEPADCRALFVEQLLDLLEAAGGKPAHIDVASRKAYQALKPSADKLGIAIRLNPQAAALLHAREAIESGM